MPRYYFHLCAPDERFEDPEGSEISDLSEAHSRALRLADRVMMFGGFARSQPDLGRWTVQIADERQKPVLTVIFPAHFEKRNAIERLNGAHVLHRRVATSSNETLLPFSARSSMSTLQQRRDGLAAEQSENDGGAHRQGSR